MNNRRQQQDEVQIPPILQEQYNLPIFDIIRQLRAGRNQRVALKTEDEGFFLSAVNGGGGIVAANSIRIGSNEIFTLIPQGGNREKVAIQTSNGNYLSAIDGGGNRVDATSTIIGINELFTMVPVGPDKANFVTSKGYILLTLPNEPRLLTAYGVAAGPRTRMAVIPQA
jgi:hypothetical protein